MFGQGRIARWSWALRFFALVLLFCIAPAVPLFADSTTTLWGAPTDVPVVGDFDGDGKSDIAVWRPSTGYWYVIQSSNGAHVAKQWGAPTDVPVVGDFDGDGKSDIAVWRPSTGYWYIIQSSNGAVATKQWGAPTDKPVLGDFDGDGKTDIAVWRPSTGYWYVIQSSNGAIITKQWGAPTDLPVVGDFDGDGKSDIAVWRSSTGYWYIIQSSNGAVVTKQWGGPTDKPVLGDFDGDGRTDIAVWRPSTGYWYVIQSSSGAIVTQQWGAPMDIPVVGDFDGDGKSDIVVWRASDGSWYDLSGVSTPGSGGSTTTRAQIDPSISSVTSGSIEQFVTPSGTAVPGSPVPVNFSSGETLLLALDTNGNVVMAALVTSSKTVLSAASTTLALVHLLVADNPSAPSASNIDAAIVVDPAYQTLLATITHDLTTGTPLTTDASVLQSVAQVAVDVDSKISSDSSATSHLTRSIKADISYASALPVTLVSGGAGISASLFVNSVISQKIDVINFTPIPWTVGTSLSSGGTLSPNAPIADNSDAQLTMANSEFTVTAEQDDASYNTLVNEVVFGDLESLLAFVPSSSCPKSLLKNSVKNFVSTLNQQSGGGATALMNAVSAAFTVPNLTQIATDSSCSPLQYVGAFGKGLLSFKSLISKVQAAASLVGATGQVVYYDLHANDSPVTIGLCGNINWQIQSCAEKFAFSPSSLLMAPGAVAALTISATDSSGKPTGVPGNIVLRTSDPTVAFFSGSSEFSYSPGTNIISILAGTNTSSSPATITVTDPFTNAMSLEPLSVSVVYPIISPSVQTASIPSASQTPPQVSFTLTDASGNPVLVPLVTWQPNTPTTQINTEDDNGNTATFSIPPTATPGTIIPITATGSNGDKYFAQSGEPAQLILTTGNFAGTVEGTLPLTGFTFACSPGPTCTENDVTFGVTIGQDGSVGISTVNQDGNWFITNCAVCSPFGTFYDWPLVSGTLTTCVAANTASCGQVGSAVLGLEYDEDSTSTDGLDYCQFTIVLTPGETGITATAKKGSLCDYVGKGVQSTLPADTGPPAITFTAASQ